jgi:hypothetical protein
MTISRNAMAIMHFGVLFMALGFMTGQSVAKPKKVKCDPDGTANERIGCLHNANVDQWSKLNSHYSRYLDSLIDKCAKDNPGGGSGGFEDRTTCVSKALEAEAKRVNL